ncbi:MAG TPA: hypothetical protein EYG57_07010 [Planctomycetes bacterium]|uniref:hypothetical protein n=1 Tax=Henriciella sp. TaxID=1968823 RepID=UPI0017EB75F7|nr:hypothetical protein [Henriciella sp.]HIG21770.1 hypothetical protein [Henriciella sp.]HIM29290.1 hypothetical protein [Planctomycetota bacterium]
MDMLKIAIASSAIALALAAPAAKADNLAVGLSPHGESSLKQAEAKDAIRLMLETVEPGETASVFDAFSGELICTFEVPDRSSYRSAKAKLNKNAGCVRRILQFTKSANADGEAGALDLSEFLRLLARQAPTSQLETVVIFGSPIINNPRQPSLYMAGGRIPSDGHVFTDRANSPFSMSGLGKPLEGVAIHFASEGYRWSVNDQHSYFTGRFWAISSNALGAELATFSADRDQLIERVKSGVRQPTEKFEPSPSDKLEMLQVRIDRGRYVPIYDREVSTSELEASEIAEAKNVELGIKWDCSSCDLDIYARPGPGADILYFGRTRSREGVFHKDFVQGRDLMNGLETISFSAPINLNELLIAVNLYSGHQADGISGEVRLAVDGRTYAREFKISAEKGNRASGLTNLLKSGSATNDAWITIDPVALVSAQ